MKEAGGGLVGLRWKGKPWEGLPSRVSEILGFPGGSVGKEFARSAGDLGSVPGSGRFPEEGSDNPLQYSCLENPMDRGSRRVTDRGWQRVRHN